MSLRTLYLCVFIVSLILHHQVSSEIIHLNEGFGRIKVGDFGSPYGDNIDKTWVITVRPGYKVKLFFTTFDLEDSYEDGVGACAYDYVQVEGHRRLCGNREFFPQDAPGITEVFFSKSNVMKIRFVSDYSNEVPKPIGFDAHYVEEDADECMELKEAFYRGEEGWDELLYCNHYCNNIPGSYYCSCRHGFTLNENQHTCVANCEEEVTADPDGGFISSSDYPHLYSKLMNCETTLSAGIGRSLDVRFDAEFGIEEHYEEGCVYDWLQLKVKGNLMTYCGNVAPNNGRWILLDAKSVDITFHSDLTNEDKGYKMYYRIHLVKCREVVRAPSNGSIYNSPNKSEFEFGDRIEFSCNRGYRMQGSRVIFCDENGSWSNSPPTCHIKYCPRPTDLLSVPRTAPPSFNETERPFGSNITIRCINKWYELVSGASVWTCDDDEEWHPAEQPELSNNNNNHPECRPICGIKNAKEKYDLFKSHILKGTNVKEGEFPWMAFVDMGGGLQGDDSFCGGSLVDEQFVVTAGHCIQWLDKSVITVYLGVTDRSDQKHPHMQRFSVIEMTVHPEYESTPNPNAIFDSDIAVLKLNRPAVIGRYVRPICIPRSKVESELHTGSIHRGLVLGWGITETDSVSKVLRKVRVPYVNNTVCSKAYREQSKNHQSFSSVSITNNNICAGFLNNAKDSCGGDSGGPLMWKLSKKWFLNGIVSFGTSLGGCGKNVLGVYTKVANYIPFLNDHTILAP